jgi:hypothetical protein
MLIRPVANLDTKRGKGSEATHDGNELTDKEPVRSQWRKQKGWTTSISCSAVRKSAEHQLFFFLLLMFSKIIQTV